MQTSEKKMEERIGNKKNEKDKTSEIVEVKGTTQANLSQDDLEEYCDCVNCRLGRIEKRIERLLARIEKDVPEKRVLYQNKI